MHVHFQHLVRDTDLMETVVRRHDFSDGLVEELARTPSVRWWYDCVSDVIWEMRVHLRTVPARMHGFSHQELSFANLGREERSVLLPSGAQLGELTEEQLRFLIRKSGVQAARRSEPGTDGGRIGVA